MMTFRKKRLLITQLILLGFGVLIIYFTYYKKDPNTEDKIISKKTEEIIKDQLENEDSDKGDIFFNIEYSGLDLAGNRYLLKSEEAYLDSAKPEIVYMTKVNAVFYFKDDTTLYVWSDTGIYNNKTLDMKFSENVKANYLETQLFAQKADYSNSNSYLSIYEDVRINDAMGNLVADKLLFDITKRKLDITSFNNGNINANINLNEKRF